MEGPYPLKVGVESTFVHVMGMTDIVTDHGFFAAYHALL